MPPLKTSTGRLTCTSSRRGILAGANAINSRTPPKASAVPAAPPANASTRLSARRDLTSWPRLAPSAARTAVSRSALTARASCRLARLTHAISSTAPTAANSSQSAPLTPDATSCRQRRECDSEMKGQMRGQRVRLLQGFQFGVRLGQRDAGLEPRDRLIVEVAHICIQVALAWRQRLKEQRITRGFLKGDLRRQCDLRKPHARRQHTDDSDRMAFDPQCFANHRRVAAQRMSASLRSSISRRLSASFRASSSTKSRPRMG